MALKPTAPDVSIRDLTAGLSLHASGYWTATRTEAVSYPEDGNALCWQIEEHSFWFRHRNQVLVDVLKRYPIEGPLFDVGGGNGFVSQGLQQAGIPTVLVEPGPTGARNALRRGIRDVICATVENAGFKLGSLPGVGLFDVVEHIRDDQDFLQTIHRLLKPQGRVFITVPAYQVLWSAEDQDGGHFRRYTLGSLRKTLQRSGFCIEYLTCVFWFLPLPVLLFRTLPWWLGRRHTLDADTTIREHVPRQSLLSGVLDRALQVERSLLRRGYRLPVGGSCLAVAHR